VRDGPIVRHHGFAGRGFVTYRDLDGLEVDEAIVRTIRAYAERGESFEWKHHGHDRPDDLPERLREAGFEPEERETVVIARVADIAGDVALPDGVALREVGERAEFDRIGEMQADVWGERDYGWLSEMLEGERIAAPEAIAIFVAEAGEEVVSAAWVRFQRGTDFATLWGGATRKEWRGRGIYKALVRHRANLAAERGFTYLEVDASDDSRPILERLGFVAVTTTTPYVWSP
jgi:ribosomal protein S18 acetylase RimI-like enzyme